MNSNEKNPILNMTAVILTWLASLSLVQVQNGISIVSGMAVLVYTVVKTYYLVKNKGQE